jgi:hypothetical protein
MCDCISQMKQKIHESVKSKYNVDNCESESAAVAVFLVASSLRTYTPYEAIYYTKSKYGKDIKKKERVCLFHTFCPFCGQRYDLG